MTIRSCILLIVLSLNACYWEAASHAQVTSADESLPISVAILPFHSRAPISSNPNDRGVVSRSRTETTANANEKENEESRRENFGNREVRSRNLTSESSSATETTIKSFDAETDKGIAMAVADLLTIKLLMSDNLMLVERAEIERIFDELKLSRSGVVNASEANQVGRLSGAKLLVTGSVVRIDNELHLIAKVMGSETSRLAGASVKGPANSDLDQMVYKLASELEKVIRNKGNSLLPKIESEVDWVTRINREFAGKILPTVTVQLQSTNGDFDLAAATELERLLKELGFNVIASDHVNARRADFAVVGEAKSEFAYRRGDWVATRCRIDLQIRSQADGRVVVSDSETCTIFDIAERLAGKEGLQDAMRRLVERIATKLVP